MFNGEDYITYTLAAGYLTDASYRASGKLKKKFGRFAYVLSGLKSFFKFKEFPMTVTCDGERIHGKFTYMMLVNGESTGGFRINKNDNSNDGKVKLVLIKKGKLASGWFTFVKLFLLGIDKAKKSKNIIVKDVEKVEIENHANIAFTLDGEKCKFLKKTITANKSLTFIQK